MPVLSDKGVAVGGSYRRTRLGALKSAAGEIKVQDDLDLVGLAAQISEGAVGALFQGRSEYGPRALGQRSILGAAVFKGHKRRMNRLKKRSYFMPVAPATVEEAADRYFHCPVAKRHMTEVVKIRDGWHEALAAAMHADGWCRIQTVSKTSNPIFYRLIELIGERTGFPIVLNTRAHSTVKCNEQIFGVEENLARGLVAEYLSGARVKFILDPLDIGIGQNREV